MPDPTSDGKRLLDGLVKVAGAIAKTGYHVGRFTATLPDAAAVEGTCGSVGPGGIRCLRPEGDCKKFHRGEWGFPPRRVLWAIPVIKPIEPLEAPHGD